MKKIVVMMMFLSILAMGCGQAEEPSIQEENNTSDNTVSTESNMVDAESDSATSDATDNPVDNTQSPTNTSDSSVPKFSINGQTIEMHGMIAKYLNDAKSEMIVVLSNQKNLSCEDYLPALNIGESRLVFNINNTDLNKPLTVNSYPYLEETSVKAYKEDDTTKVDFESSDINSVRITKLDTEIVGNAGFSKEADSVTADFKIKICE